MHSLRPGLALVTFFSLASYFALTLHAQTGSPTSSQNQGTRPVGTSTAVSGTPTTLFAYGSTTTADIAVPQTDDGSVSTSWAGTGPEGSSLTLAFLNNSYGGLFVNTNGTLSFGSGISAFAGTNLTSHFGAPLLAPFFADVDLRPTGSTTLPSGNLWYRTTQNAAELASITARLSTSNLAPQNFNPTFAQIVTWDKVGRFGGNAADNTKVSTFQAVLITDGTRTYSLFLYPENAIWWDNGILPEQAGTFARIGYSAGDGVTGYEVAGSGTVNARDLSITSNTGQPGTFVFDVGGTLASRVVNGTLTLPATAGTAANVLQLSANAAGHTITSTAAAGSLLFNQLTFDDPANTVAFTDRVVALAHAADAITAGNITFANNTVLVAQAAGALNGGTLTLKDSAKLAIYAEGASTTATALTFNKTSGTGGTLDLRGFNTGIGAVNSTGTTAGVITNSGATASTLTLGGTGSGDFNGTLQNGTSLLHLAKTGTGTQLLSGTNTYTGTTTVSGGTLQFAQTSAFYNGTIDVTTATKLTAQTGGIAAFNVGGAGEFSSAQLTTIVNNASFSGGGLGLDTTNATGGAFTLNANPGASVGLVKLGAGVLTLAGTNPDLGGVTVHAGTLQLGDFGNSISHMSAVTVNSGTFRLGAANETIGALAGTGGLVDLFNGAGRTLTVGGSDASTTYAGSIQGTGGSLVKTGTGTLTLTGANSYTGDTLLAAGTLQIGNGGSSGSLASNVTNNTALVFNRSDALTFTGAISGTGTLAKTGAGTLILANANTFTGTTTISAGSLKLGHSLALQGSTLNYSGSGLSFGTLTAASLGGLSGSGFLNLSNDTAAAVDLTVGGNGASTTFSGFLNGAGSLTKTGPGTLTLSGPNGYTGGTVLSEGTIKFGNSVALGSSGIISFNGGTLQFSQSASFSDPTRFSTAPDQRYRIDTNGQNVALPALTSPGGSLTKSGAGILVLTGANTYTGGTIVSEGTLIIGTNGTAGSLTGNIANDATLAFSRSDALIYAGVISGIGSLEQAGIGTLTLTGTNTYTGTTTLAAGTLALGSLGALGYIGPVTFNGGILQFSAANIADYSSRFSSAANQAYKLDTNGQNVTLAHALTSSGGTLTKSGTGTLTLSGANTYTGGTILSAGTLALGSAGALGSTGTLSFTGGILQFSAANTIDYSSRFGSSTNQLYHLDTNGQNVTLATALLSSGGSLTKSGAGILTLGGTNAYTGGTTINAGTLQIGAGGASGSLTGNITNNGALAFNRSNALSFSGLVSGTGSLTQLGAGTLTLTATHIYAGGTTVSAGTLQLGDSGTVLPDAGTVTVNGGTLRVGAANETIGSLAGTGGAVDLFNTSGRTLTVNQTADTTFAGLLQGNGGTLVKTGTGSLTLDGTNTFTGSTTVSAGTLQIGNGGTSGSLASGNIVNSAALAFNRSDALTYGGVISGTGSLTKLGTGTTTLTGNNTYSGTTTISTGTLQIGNGGTTGSVAGNIVNNAALTFNRSDSLSYANVISGTGALTKTGDGTLTLTGANTYTGGTTVSAGTLEIGAGGTTGSITGDVVNHGDLIFNRSDALTFAGAVSGSGYLIKDGAGTLTLTGASTYTGTTIVFAGTLQIGNGSTSGSVAAPVLNNASLAFNRSDALTHSGAISGTGSLNKLGAGTLTLTGANTYTGGTTLSAGTLALGSSGALGSTGTLSFGGGILQFSSANTTDYSARFSNAASQTYKLDTNGQNVTLTSALTSSGGSLTKSGTGTLTLTAANTFAGGTTIDAGTVQIGNGGTSGSVAGNITNSAALTFNRSDALSYAGGISGTGSFTKLGAGTLTLSGANTYTGTTTVSEGTLQIGAGGTTGSLANSALAIAAGATVRFDRSTNSTFAGSISGTGTLVKTGAGNLTFSGAAPSFQGSLQVNQGLLILATGGNAIGDSSPVTIASGASISISGGDENFGSLAGAGSLLLANRTFGVNHAGTVEFSGTITDTGAVNKAGSGNWILSGTNTYVGPTALNAGTLTAGSASAFGNGTVRVNAGTLALGGYAIANALDVRGGSVTGLSSYTGIQTLSAALTYSGTVGGAVVVASGGSLNTTGATFTGTTTVQTGGLLSGTGTLSGPTTLSSGSHLAPGNSPGTLTFTNGLTLDTGAILDFELGSTLALRDLIVVSGGALAGSAVPNGITLNLTDAGGFTAGNYTLINYATASGTSQFGADRFVLGSTIAGYTYNLATVGNTLQLTALAAIPEPSTYAMFAGGCGLALALIHRRRRNRAC